MKKIKNRFKHALPRLFGGIVFAALVGFLVISIIKVLLLIAFTGVLLAGAIAYFYKTRITRRSRKSAANHAEQAQFYASSRTVIPVPVFANTPKSAITPIQ